MDTYYNFNIDTYYHLDNAYIHDPLPFGNISLVQIGRMFCKENTVIDKHVHLNWFELTIVTDGEGTILTNGERIPVKSGDIHLSYPADVHEILSSTHNPLTYDFFSFFTEEQKWKADLELIMRSFTNAQARLFSDERIKILVDNGIAEFCDKNVYSTKLLQSIFEQIIIYLIRDFKEKETPAQKGNLNQAESLCYQIMNYIDTHVFALHSLSELCETFAYNYSYLSSLFKKTTGRTLLDYYQNAKLKKAKTLLTANNCTVSNISEMLHYSSVYAFSKAFKKKYGVCPTGIRNE